MEQEKENINEQTRKHENKREKSTLKILEIIMKMQKKSLNKETNNILRRWTQRKEHKNRRKNTENKSQMMVHSKRDNKGT